jgi:hypothetical protein
MSDTHTVNDTSAVRAEDLVPVSSRISWGPIFAGSAVAFTLFFLLALLGGALGLSVSGEVRGDNIATGAAVWAIVTTALSLFVGGFITSQFTVGENKLEALVYGLIMWAVVFAAMLWLMASGVKAGFNAMVGVATVGSPAASQVNWEEEAKKQGVSHDQINEWRKKANEAPDRARTTVQDPQNQQAARDAATTASWWAFGGVFLSMLTAALGALVGAGPSFRLVEIGRATTYPSARH